MSFAESIARDTKQALRGFAREKAFTVTVLFTFALCCGANVAIFAVVNSVLLKPLPFHASEQLVIISNSYPKAGVDRAGSSVPHYLERREGTAAFNEMAAFNARGTTIGDAGSPDRIDSMEVTPSFFPLLEARPAMGRTFSEEEGVYGKNQVVVISDALWRQRFAADPQVIGRSLRIDTESRTIIGVMPPQFHFLSKKALLWIPRCFSDEDRKETNRHSNNMEAIARLRPGATAAEAEAQIQAINQRALEKDPYAKLVIDAGFHTIVRGLHEDYVASIRPVLLLLQAGVLFLLVIGIVNVANLLLVRASGRTKDYSIRLALGAGQAQLARQLMTETLLLAVAGGGLGLLFGAALLQGLRTGAVNVLPMASPPTLDGMVCLFSLGVAVTVGLVLSGLVVWHCFHLNLAQTLSVESRGGTTTRAVHRVRHTLIVAQIALAFVLLSGTGLLGLSFARVLAVDPGFRVENVLTSKLSLPWSNYKEEKQRIAFSQRLMTELQTLPGVSSVGLCSSIPFTGGSDNNAITVEGYTPPPGESIRAHYTNGVLGDYFNAMGIALREGRFLTSDDSQTAAKVCVVDDETARRYWPKGDALGHRLYNGAPGEKKEFYTIVGVVGAVKQDNITDQAATGAIYFPYSGYTSLSYHIVARTQQNPESVGAALRTAVLRLDPELPLHDLKTTGARVNESLDTRRAPLLIAGVFAVVALILASVGIYGVLAYTVAQRRREIGVRMALGAMPGQIRAQFLGLGTRLVLVGLSLGGLGAWLAGRGMSSLLFGVTPHNPLVLSSAALLLCVVALAACLIPSRRAASVSPLEALRD